jgi:hypothetical protein
MKEKLFFLRAMARKGSWEEVVPVVSLKLLLISLFSISAQGSKFLLLLQQKRLTHLVSRT